MDHWKCVKRLLSYIAGTPHYSVLLKPATYSLLHMLIRALTEKIESPLVAFVPFLDLILLLGFHESKVWCLEEPMKLNIDM